jgi:hypothetical protein
VFHFATRLPLPPPPLPPPPPLTTTMSSLSDDSFDILSSSSDDEIVWPISSPSPPFLPTDSFPILEDDYILLPRPKHILSSISPPRDSATTPTTPTLSHKKSPHPTKQHIKSQATPKSRQPKKQKSKKPKPTTTTANGLGSRPIVDDVSESGTNNDDNHTVSVSMYEEAVNYMTA